MPFLRKQLPKTEPKPKRESKKASSSSGGGKLAGLLIPEDRKGDLLLGPNPKIDTKVYVEGVPYAFKGYMLTAHEQRLVVMEWGKRKEPLETRRLVLASHVERVEEEADDA
jgi:hypothetical protein